MSENAKTHELKCWPEFFESVLQDQKTFEFRKNDRDFKIGDTIELQEWREHNEPKGFSGRKIKATIDYILEVEAVPFGQIDICPCVIISIKKINGGEKFSDKSIEEEFEMVLGSGFFEKLKVDGKYLKFQIYPHKRALLNSLIMKPELSLEFAILMTNHCLQMAENNSVTYDESLQSFLEIGYKIFK